MDIFVVDDDLSQRLYVKVQLERMGHRAELFADATQVLAQLRTSSTSLVICDIDMPEMDGLAFVRAVRDVDWGRYIYVILLTRRDQTSDLIAGLDAGADDFISKPLQPAVLAVRLNAARRVLAYDEDLRIKNARLTEAKLQIEDDLRAAELAQRALLPSGELSFGQIAVRSLFEPSQFVSGDIFNYFRIEDDVVGFYAADVSGHGVRAALLAVALGHVLTPSMLAWFCRGKDGQWTPDRLAGELNRRFSPREDTAGYFTMVCGVIDLAAAELNLCEAGHPPVIILRKDGDTEPIGAGGMPVGLLADASYETSRHRFAPGDRLLVYSDGLSEAANPAGMPFTEQRIVAALAEVRDAPMAGMLRHLVDRLGAWSECDILADDLSLIGFDWRAT